MIALSTDGNQRYSWMKNSRSLFVNWTRPRSLRCNMISCCLRAAFSASSWLLGLKSEATGFKRKTVSAAIAADVKQFCRQIKTDEVFGTHNGVSKVVSRQELSARAALDRGASDRNPYPNG